MQLVEGVTRVLPMMLLVHVAQGHGVGKNLVKISHALRADVFVQRNRHAREFSEGLNFLGLLVQDGACALRSRFEFFALGAGSLGLRAHIMFPWTDRFASFRPFREISD